METITKVRLDLHESSYDVLIRAELLKEAGDLIRTVAPNKTCAVFSDSRVATTHARVLHQSLADAGFQVVSTEIIADERRKTLATYERLATLLLEAGFERNSPLVALGGGITGDVTGFVASTYQRGVPFVQCPTTLLAMVDASVGGKVAVNLSSAKNMIGAFYQPRLVLIDLSTLSTLDLRQIRCGLAECIKHGLLGDAGLFDWITHRIPQIESVDPDTMQELVTRNIQFKADIVAEDEEERGKRALLNFGHTFGHALEFADTDKRYLHGEAVSIGVVAATWLSMRLGYCGKTELDAVERAYSQASLPIRNEVRVDSGAFVAAMKRDKKVDNQTLRLILLFGIGDARIVADVPDALVKASWDYVAA